MERDKHSGKVLDGRYELIRLIDEGGMGAVYLGRHVKLGRSTAVKFLHKELLGQTTVVKRFYREAQAASAIAHPNIIDVYDVGVADWGEPYIVMEYLEGENLDSLLKRKGPIDLPAALGVLEPALRALGAAHEKGIVHRDLKPENIFITRPPDSPPLVKLIDFGISKFVEGDLSKLTRTGTLLGTPSFMSPEQARGKGEFDHRADLYSTGVILFLMLTGELPFTGESYNDLIITILTEPPKDPFLIAPNFPAAVDPVLQKLLSRDPADRYQSCQELIEALETLDGYEQRVEALTELTNDMPEDRFATGDLGSMIEREELAETVFAEMTATPGAKDASASDKDASASDKDEPGGTHSPTGESSGPDEPDMGSWKETVDLSPPRRYRRQRFTAPVILSALGLAILGGFLLFSREAMFPSNDGPDETEEEIQKIKALQAHLQSAADRASDVEGRSPEAVGAVPDPPPDTEEPRAPEDTGEASDLESDQPAADSAAGEAPGSDPDTEEIAVRDTVESERTSPIGVPEPPLETPPVKASPDQSSDDTPSDLPGTKTSTAKASRPKRSPDEPSGPPPEPPPEPPVALAPVTLTPDDVDQLVESKSPAIEACYEKARNLQPDIGGKLVVKVTISDNRIWAMVTENELSLEMGTCVVKAIRTIRPPPTTNSTTILKEILFRVKKR